jgi:hypothetical protein
LCYTEGMKKCSTHGGTEWKGGYCDKWSTDAGKGPCVETHEPEPGTYAHTARMLVDCGMDPDEADRWKDEMKERDL